MAAGLAVFPIEPVDPGLVEVGGDGHADGGKSVIADRFTDLAP
jgi:hypothetical protein